MGELAASEQALPHPADDPPLRSEGRVVAPVFSAPETIPHETEREPIDPLSEAAIPRARLAVERKPRQVAVSVYPLGLSRSQWQRLGILLIIGIVCWQILLQISAILPPFFLALCLAAIFDPTIRAEERKGRGRVATILKIYTLAFGTIVLLAVRVVPSAAEQLKDVTSNFSGYYTNVQRNVDGFLHKNRPILLKIGIKEQRLSDILNEKSGPIRDAIGAVLGGIGDFLQSAASRLLWIIVIPVAGFFLMRDFPVLRARFIAFFPEAQQEKVDDVSREIVDVFSAYLRGLGKICVLFGICACLLFWMLGVDYALILGVLAGMFYAVPYVGQLGTSTVVGTVAYSMAAHRAFFVLPIGANSAVYTVSVIVCLLGMGILFDQLVYPRIVGGSVGLHPVVSIFSLTVGATLFGVPGVLLAVPVAASIQIILMTSFPRLAQPPPAHLLEAPPPLA